MGAEIIKLFPARAAGGTDFIKQILGPCPATRLLPMGIDEVSMASLATWFKAGACGVGIGGELIRSDRIAAGDFAAIGSRVAEVRDMVRQARGYGRVINIGSLTCVFGYAGIAAYCASRGGMKQLTMSLAAGAEPVDFETLLAESDYLSCHVPLTTETRHLFDRAAFARMKPTAVFVNTSRGGLVDTTALRDGRLSAAGIDVHEQEPVPADDAEGDLAARAVPSPSPSRSAPTPWGPACRSSSRSPSRRKP